MYLSKKLRSALPNHFGIDSVLYAEIGFLLALLLLEGFSKDLVAIYVVIIASTVGLFAYKWQKNLDRENEISLELRGLYGEFVEASKTIYFSQPMIGVEVSEAELKEFFSIGPKEQRFNIIRDKIVLLGPVDVVNAVQTHDDAVRKWKIAFPEEDNVSSSKKLEMDRLTRIFIETYNDVLRVMRVSVSGKITS